MRIESIRARAFGPFKNAQLTLSPGLTVVHGLNEAGKSSWHAAIYAGLCGMRRGKGKTGADQQFSSRHRPWTGEEWRVDLVLKLDDGRRVELHQNLADLTDCHASDADFGGDISAEILNGNTPDASIWLGLDRETFSAVACVRQAEILDLADEDVAYALQEQLQKAAASTARDATAAQAIERLHDFQRERVGREQANSTKPLQQAKRRLELARTVLQDARKAHGEWLSLEAEANELNADSESKRRLHDQLIALRARQDSDGWNAKLQRARTIEARFPSGPPTVAEQVAVAEEASTALEQWQQRPEVPTLGGESAASLRSKIDDLPAIPIGDLEPDPKVVQFKSTYDQLNEAIKIHDRQRPQEPEVLSSRLTPETIRELAREIELGIPSVDPKLESAYQRAREQSNQPTTGSGSDGSQAASIAALALGVTLWWFGYRIGATVIGLGAFVAFVLLALRDRSASQTANPEMLNAIEAQLDSQRRAVQDAKGRIQAAQARIRAEGLPSTAAELRALADAIVLTAERRQQLTLWNSRTQSLASELQDARSKLLGELQRRGVAVEADPESAFEHYRDACRARSRQAALAASKSGLQHQLDAREAAERAASGAARRNTEVAGRLLTLDRQLGRESRNADEAVANLRAWREKHSELLAKFQQDSSEYAELTAILDGHTIQDLEAKAEQTRLRAQKLADQIRGFPHGDQAFGSGLNAEVVEQDANEASQAAAAAQARAAERSQGLVSVAEAEEEVERATLELERCRRLQSTLTETLKFLSAAQEKVHRDIAPQLASALKQWLPAVTQQRYTDARVNPSDLSIQVLDADQNWRDAWNLSHGTLEQLYLLLRVVLAGRIVTTNETCPLILDDVLVQCDRVRKLAILDALKTISGNQQVILFTQEDEVLRWAEALPVGQLIRLPDPMGAK